MRTLITEFAAHELATEGIEKVVQSTLSWLEKHRGSFVDIDLGSELTEEKFFVKPLFQEIEVKPETIEPKESEIVPDKKEKYEEEPIETKVEEEKEETLQSLINKLGEKYKKQKVYTVQVGAFLAEGDALNLSKEIKSKGYQTYVIKGETLYKVQVGEFKSYQEAQNIAQKLNELGYYGYITTR